MIALVNGMNVFKKNDCIGKEYDCVGKQNDYIGKK